MADQNPSTNSGQAPSSLPTTTQPAGINPISPQIKIPTPQAIPPPKPPLPTGQIGSSLPPNLPVRPVTPTLVQPKPPVTPVTPIQSAPPIIQKTEPAKPIALSPQPQPVASAPRPDSTSSPQASTIAPSFKSSIRTMSEDIAALKKGQPPVGVQIEKQVEKAIAPPPSMAPKVTPPPPRTPEMSGIELGKMEKARPLPAGTLPPNMSRPTVPTIPPAKMEGIKPPALKGGVSGPKILILELVGLIVIGSLAWYFIWRHNNPPLATSTPTPTATPVVILKPAIESAFSVFVIDASASSGPELFSKLEHLPNKETLLVPRVPILYKVFEPLSTGHKRYTLSGLMSAGTTQVPADVAPLIYDNSVYLTLLAKNDQTNSYGVIVRLKDSSDAATALKAWEKTLSNDLKDLFKFSLTKSASSVFLDNTYQGISIRYRNFSDPEKTVDYAVVTMANGEKYLIFTNSRGHIYAIIDKLLGYSPGK